MKKALFSLAICALTLLGCTSEGVLTEGPQSDAITFRNVVNKNSRALDSNTFNKFFVYGYYTKGNDLNRRFSIFTDTPVSKYNDGWSSAISRYWVSGATYSFFAFSCENLDIAAKYGGASIGQADGKFRINYTCHSDNGGNSHDLLFASSVGILGKETDNLPVPLQFKHILSKVSLKFVSDFPDGYVVRISNVKITDFENMGTFTASSNANEPSLGTWAGVKYDENNNNSFTLNSLNGDTTSSLSDPVETSPCFMIPNTYDPLGGDNPVKIQFNIDLINVALNQTIVSNTLVGSWHPKWRQGTQYVYTIHISGNEAGMDKIDFGVSVADWNDPDSDNVPETISISLDYILQNSSEGK